jgi:hypothetical protein
VKSATLPKFLPEQGTPTATRVSGANAAVYVSAAWAWTIPLGQLTQAQWGAAGAELRFTPATTESLLAWGRNLPRTGRKKKDLDL